MIFAKKQREKMRDYLARIKASGHGWTSLVLLLAFPFLLSAVAVIGYQDLQIISTPGNPGSGYLRFFATSGGLNCLTSAGANCLSGLTPGGSAGGDLSGTYPNPTVVQVNGAAVPASAGLLASNSSRQLVSAGASNVYGLFSGTCSSSTYLSGSGACSTPSGTGFANPMTTLGDLIVGGASGAANRLAVGTNNNCIVANSGATFGVNWAPCSNNQGFGASFGSVASGSSALVADTAYFTLPHACTIAGWNISVNAGTATFDIWKVATGTAIPTVTNTITASALPAISTGTAIHSATLTGWTTSVAANDIVAVNLKTVATATYASLVVECN